MTATTAIYAWPYPQSTDPPAGHTQIQALANAVETTVDSLDDRLDVVEPLVTANTAAVATKATLTTDVTAWRTLYIVKPSDTGRTSTATFADDPHLVLALPVGTWRIDLGAQVDGNSGNMKVQWATTGTITLVGSRICQGISEKNNDPNGQLAAAGGDPMRACATTSFTATFSPTNSVVGYGTDSSGTAGIRETMIVACTVAGNLKMQWAQFVSNADTTTVRLGSWITATRLA